MIYPAQNIEIERVYRQILAASPCSAAIMAASAGEGVTSMALALAQRSLLAGRSTLLVDLNFYRPALTPLLSLPEAQPGGLFCPPQLVGLADESVALTGIAAPRSRDALLRLRKPGLLQAAIRQWHESYDTVLFDTSPLNQINANNLPAEQVAAACDTSVLVVLSGHTTAPMVEAAMNKLVATGAQLGGCVLNDRHHPSLRSELLRETGRLHPRFHRLRTWLENSLLRHRLLSLET